MSIQDRNAPQRVSPTTLFLSGLVTVLCLGLVGGGDYDQEQADARFTCNMVSAKAWPSAVKPECGGRPRHSAQQQVANL